MQRSRTDGPCEHHDGDASAGSRCAPPGSIQARERGANENREPERRRHVADRGQTDERDGKPVTAPEQRSDRKHPEAERHEAWMKVGFERVGARAWDAMPQRDHRGEGDGQPR